MAKKAQSRGKLKWGVLRKAVMGEHHNDESSAKESKGKKAEAKPGRAAAPVIRANGANGEMPSEA